MSSEMIALYGAVGGSLLAIVVYFLKRTMNKVDEHGIKISHIELTYVEKEELKIARSEIKNESIKLAADISDMKETFLTKEDFYRSQSAVDKKLDKIYDLILAMKGGNINGQR